MHHGFQHASLQQSESMNGALSVAATIQDCEIFYIFSYFFHRHYVQRMYVIVEIDRAPEEARDLSTWIRVPLTVYACILREAVGVRAGLRRVTQSSSACFTRHTTPTILAKSPAKSLLLITRQREYHGQGILLFIMMWFISLEPLGSVFPPPRFPCVHALPLSPSPSHFISLPWWHLLSRFVLHLLSSRRASVSSVLYQFQVPSTASSLLGRTPVIALTCKYSLAKASKIAKRLDAPYIFERCDFASASRAAY